MNMAQNDDTNIKHGFNSLVAGSTNSAAIEAYYDEWAKTYDATLKEWDYRTPAEAAATLSVHLKPGANILDVGCGTGMFSKAMSGGLECRIQGMDISSASLKIAERAVATAAVRDAYSGGLLNLCVAEKGAEGWRRLLRRHAPVLLNT